MHNIIASHVEEDIVLLIGAFPRSSAAAADVFASVQAVLSGTALAHLRMSLSQEQAPVANQLWTYPL